MFHNRIMVLILSFIVVVSCLSSCTAVAWSWFHFCCSSRSRPCSACVFWMSRRVLSVRVKKAHGIYSIVTSFTPCSYATSSQSIGLSNITTFEISNPLFLSIYKNFKRMVVDAYVYNKYCRSRWVDLDIGQRWRGNHFADINWWFPKDKLSVLKQALIRS